MVENYCLRKAVARHTLDRNWVSNVGMGEVCPAGRVHT